MKLLLKKILIKILPLKIRNTIKLYPQNIIKSKISQQSSTSCTFFWRTDNNFVTKFNFSDIALNLLNKKKSHVEIHIFNKLGNLIKIIKLKNLKTSNSFIIDKNLLNGIEDFGTFYIYHILNNLHPDEIIKIHNKCYTGYSKNGLFFSFLHGNKIGLTYSYVNKKIYPISELSLLKNYEYKISKPFKNFEKNEIFIANPNNAKIYFSLLNKDFELAPKASSKILVNDVVVIKSNYPDLRPIAFSYNKDFFDPYHC